MAALNKIKPRGTSCSIPSTSDVCPICGGLGLEKVVIDGNDYYKLCRCTIQQINLERLKASGLERQIQQCTFDNFTTAEDWQKRMLDKAKKYAAEPKGKWLYIGGQVGSGKTHLCTAVVGKLINDGYRARYITWRDEAMRLKMAICDDYEYSRLINPLKSVDVLYIDDLFKTEAGKQPTSADINLAFELLNYRYINRLMTIISCERFISELLDIDEAIGSRISEMSKGCKIEIVRDRERNYRMR